ncbi:MAG: YigZ family protein [Candidatus Neomarinimicrobiota bacterium]|nr:MAG: YigZ family protein [Candidatus Neomarinimicrobiota bacterium]
MMVTVRQPVRIQFKVKRSEFIADLFPVQSRSEVEAVLRTRKKEHPKARHICWAYRLYHPESVVEYGSDAGEPSGTAGTPILHQLQRRNLVQCGLTVVRYFGGIKLGIRGLIDAYGQAAANAVDAAQCVRFVPVTQGLLMAPFRHIGDLNRIVSNLEGRIVQDLSGETIRWKVAIPDQVLEDFSRKIGEIPNTRWEKIEQA